MASNQQMERIMRYGDMIRRQAGLAVRPYRADGYVNMMTRYGTSRDISEQYRFVPEQSVPDELLTMYYEGNGLFAKIIDTPAEEALKHGFHLNGIADQKIEDFFSEALDELDWEETAMTAIKWARLYGGSIAVLLVNDGRGLEEPLDWKNIRSIDDIRVYDRSLIQADTSTMFDYSPDDPFRTRGSRLGMPEYYHVFSRYGNFTVHDSRCLVFRNGILPEGATNSEYQLWGTPEYVRIHKAIRDAEIAHGSAPKLLDRSVQPVYKMKDLQQLLATEDGEDQVLQRLRVIDMARGLLNSLVIDKDGEEYDFKTFTFAGVSNVISAACNMLSAITNIPQTILFGQTVGGLSTTDDTSTENYYNFVERIQRRMLRSNLRYLLSIIFQAGVSTGEVDEVPKIKVEFNPLWSMSDVEKADLEQKKANTQNLKAHTARIYVDMQAMDASEVRKSLADSDEFNVEEILDEISDDDLFPPDLTPDDQDDEEEGNAPDAAPTATKLPEDMSKEEQGGAKATSRGDGGPGSGNFEHEGRPGKIGGSAPDGKAMSDAVNKAFSSDDPRKIESALKKAMNDMPVGSSFEFAGSRTTKVGENEWENTNPFGDTISADPDELIESIVYWEDEYPDIEFDIPGAEEVAKAKVEAGELDPKETSVDIPTREYAGRTDFPEGSVPQEVMNRKKEELTRNLRESGEEGEMSDQEVERLVGAVKHYNLGGQCQEILSAQDPETYDFLRSTMSDERKAWASEQAEAIERFIELSDKIEAPVYRGMSFNDAYDESGGAAMKFVESLEQGRTIEFGHISSWASSRGTAKSYSEGALDAELEDGTNYSILMTVKKPKTTVSLNGINPESECLSPKSAKYKVSKVKKTYDEDDACYYYDVDLEEV